MTRHGFKGAAELAATVDYLFGYDATTDGASDWMYEQGAEKYLLDEEIAAFGDRANPWGARGIAGELGAEAGGGGVGGAQHSQMPGVGVAFGRQVVHFSVAGL